MNRKNKQACILVVCGSIMLFLSDWELLLNPFIVLGSLLLLNPFIVLGSFIVGIGLSFFNSECSEEERLEGRDLQ